MANALGQLFGEIADAIREKTGETGTMKPAQFPEKIAGIEAEGSDYNLNLAYGMMTRSAWPISGDGTTLILKEFKDPNGDTLGTLNPYSFAGFAMLKYLALSGVVMVLENALLDNPNLEIIDITLFEGLSVAGFRKGALNGCTKLESVIFRDGGAGISYATFAEGSTTGANDTFYVYVPAAYYDAIVADVDADATSAVPSSRYRKLEDYPEVDRWNEKYTVRFWDGETLMSTVTVRGGKSATVPSKAGYLLRSVNPSPTKVVSDLDCYTEWVPENLNDASWELISELSKEGTIKDFYSLGAKKEITLNYSDGTSDSVNMMIVGFNRTDENGIPTIILRNEKLLSKYAKSDAIRTKTIEYVTPALPTDLSVVMRSVKQNNLYSYGDSYAAYSMVAVPLQSDIGVQTSSANANNNNHSSEWILEYYSGKPFSQNAMARLSTGAADSYNLAQYPNRESDSSPYPYITNAGKYATETVSMQSRPICFFIAV